MRPPTWLSVVRVYNLCDAAMTARLAELGLRVGEHEVLVKQHKAARKEAETAARADVKAALLATNPDVKGLVKGQLLMKNKRDIDNKVDAAMIKWDHANPAPKRPVNATDADVATIADSFEFESVDAMLQAIEDAYGPHDQPPGLREALIAEYQDGLADKLKLAIQDNVGAGALRNALWAIVHCNHI